MADVPPMRTTEPVWFVVERRPTGEMPSVIVGPLPEHLARKIPRGPDGLPMELGTVVYQLRLDKLPPATRAQWIDPEGVPVVPLGSMHRVYRALRDAGQLPQTQ